MYKDFRRTKIVCTLGPATDQPGILELMLNAGMNVARLNFSHGSQPEHLSRIHKVKAARERTGKPLGLLMDTRGPEIRIHTLEDGRAELRTGQKFVLYAKECVGNAQGVSVTYPHMAEEVATGTKILIDDGKISMHVEKIEGEDVICRVENGGEIKNRKSINIPNCALKLPYINELDRADILFGCQNDVDFVAASFIRNRQDVQELKKVLKSAGAENRVQIIAKIENSEGFDNLDEILSEVDGVMVARGDMGVEIEFDLLPHIQKTIIKQAIAAGKIVITATQMLDSMTENPRPTRAEVSDVANAVYDGTTAVMLSGETSVGAYPVETVQTMSSIVRHAEDNIHFNERRRGRAEFQHMAPIHDKVSSEIALAAVNAAEHLDVSIIAAVTVTGRTVHTVSCMHAEKPIIGLTPNDKTFHQMTLQFGVIPLRITEGLEAGETQIRQVFKTVLRERLCQTGDLLVYTAGLPAGLAKSTNTLCVREVEDE